jgi:hypothetical protein
MGDAHWAMLVAGTQARMVLTDEQRNRVDRWSHQAGEDHKHD